jgi:phage-related protein
MSRLTYVDQDDARQTAAVAARRSEDSSFSRTARFEAGFLLRRLPDGQHIDMPASRPMPDIGRNCHELRIDDGGVTWRIIYHLSPDAVVILDVFQKKSRATPKQVIEVSRRRLRAYQVCFEGGLNYEG